MKIIITGATGLIGKKLCQTLIKRGDEVIVFSRNSAFARIKIPNANKYIEWDYSNPSAWQNELSNADAVIHLAGANLFGRRWNSSYKKNILESRIVSTKNLAEAIKNSSNPPAILITSSAVGYYGDKLDEIIYETSLPGNDFLAALCKRLEEEASAVEKYNVRRVSIRTGVVLSNEGGALKQMLIPFEFFVGGSIGNGKQWFPWIHINDIVRIYLFALDNNIIKGAINAASPNPVTMKNFAKILGKNLHRPSVFSIPKFALRIFLGEVAGAAAASQRIYPKKLIDMDFKFEFKDLDEALRDLLKQKKD